MKKFKLIKTYPNNPELGVEVVYSEMYNNYFPVGGSYNDQRTKNEVENYPEFWEEVSEAEKEYEILEYRCTKLDLNIIARLKEDGLYHFEGADYSPIPAIYSINYDIYSVKRLSDGEVFTVGDLVKGFTGDKTGFIISNIFLDSENCLVFANYSKNNSTINGRSTYLVCIQKVKQPILTTEDGVDVFSHDSAFVVCKDFKIINVYFPKSLVGDSFKEDYKFFSTKEAAEEYIKMNKPEFSRNDIINLLDKLNKDEI